MLTLFGVIAESVAVGRSKIRKVKFQLGVLCFLFPTFFFNILEFNRVMNY